MPAKQRKRRRLLGGSPNGCVRHRARHRNHVWSYDFSGGQQVVESCISHLRRKIDRVDPPLIHTVRGIGYALRVGRPAEASR